MPALFLAVDSDRLNVVLSYLDDCYLIDSSS